MLHFKFAKLRNFNQYYILDEYKSVVFKGALIAKSEKVYTKTYILRRESD